MDQTTFDDLVRGQRVLPLFTPRAEGTSCRLIELLLGYGFTVIELTLRDPSTEQLLPRLVRQFPEATLGAGTVYSAAALPALKAAGMRFAVSPGIPVGLARASESPLPVLPGVATPSEALACAELGYRLLKLFPAMQLGGLALVKALAGPFPALQFCLTGGVRENILPSLLADPAVAACGGSWLASDDELACGEWSLIEERVDALRELLGEPG